VTSWGNWISGWRATSRSETHPPQNDPPTQSPTTHPNHPPAIRQLFVKGIRPTPGVTITYPLHPSAQPPPPPSEPCPPGGPCPPTKVLADAGLADPKALGGGGSSGGSSGGSAGAGAGASAAGGRNAAAVAAIAAVAATEFQPAVADEPAGVDSGGSEQQCKKQSGAGACAGADAADDVVHAAVRPQPSAVAGEGVRRLRGDLLALVVGQSRQMGRMINACPSALLDDGLLDVTLLFGTPGQQVGLVGWLGGWVMRGGASAAVHTPLPPVLPTPSPPQSKGDATTPTYKNRPPA